MRRARGRAAAWGLLFVWSLWTFAAQGALARSAGLGAYAPDLGLVLLLGLAARVPLARARAALAAALVVGCARAAVSIDGAAPILSGYLAAVAVLTALRGWIDVDRLPVLVPLAGALALLVGLWLALVHALGAGERPELPELIGSLSADACRAALATTVAAVFPGELLLLLPGLAPLWRAPLALGWRR